MEIDEMADLMKKVEAGTATDEELELFYDQVLKGMEEIAPMVEAMPDVSSN